MTYLQSLEGQEGLLDKVSSFSDELSKIADSKTNSGSKVKKWLKNTAALSIAYGLGHGTAYASDRFISKALGRNPDNMRYLGPAAGIASLAAAYAYHKMQAAKDRKDM